MKKVKEQLGALFTDKEWDLDVSKVIGFVCIVCGIIGFFMEKANTIALLGFGSGLLGINKVVGD